MHSMGIGVVVLESHTHPVTVVHLHGVFVVLERVDHWRQLVRALIDSTETVVSGQIDLELYICLLPDLLLNPES